MCLICFVSPNMVRLLCLYFDAKAMIFIDNEDGPDLVCYAVSGKAAHPHLVVYTVALAFIS